MNRYNYHVVDRSTHQNPICRISIPNRYYWCSEPQLHDWQKARRSFVLYGTAHHAAVAQIGCPEPRQILIKPFDPSIFKEIEKAIQAANLGLNPASDGMMIRLAVPELTEERRKELVKQVKKIAEEFRVAVRNIRREAIDQLKKQKKDKEISEDDLFKLQDEAQSETDDYIAQVDEVSGSKEKEVMDV